MSVQVCRVGSDMGTVLICDDDYMVRIVGRAMFEHKGYRVIEAATGEEALVILGAEPISALIIDIVLPGISGIEVCRAVRDGETGEKMPIIVISGYAEERYIEDVYHSGASVFQKKPVSWVMVPPTVEALRAVNVPARAEIKEPNKLVWGAEKILKEDVLKPLRDAGKLLSVLEGGEDTPTGAPAILYRTVIKALREAEATLHACLDVAECPQLSNTGKRPNLTLIE